MGFFCTLDTQRTVAYQLFLTTLKLSRTRTQQYNLYLRRFCVKFGRIFVDNYSNEYLSKLLHLSRPNVTIDVGSTLDGTVSHGNYCENNFGSLGAFDAHFRTIIRQRKEKKAHSTLYKVFRILHRYGCRLIARRNLL